MNQTYGKRALVASGALGSAARSIDRATSMGSICDAKGRLCDIPVGVGWALPEVVANCITSDVTNRSLKTTEKALYGFALSACDVEERIFLQ